MEKYVVTRKDTAAEATESSLALILAVTVVAGIILISAYFILAGAFRTNRVIETPVTTPRDTIDTTPSLIEPAPLVEPAPLGQPLIEPAPGTERDAAPQLVPSTGDRPAGTQ